jgi:ketosteroid isomerase-like protein
MRNLIVSVGVLAAAAGGMFAIQRKMSQLDEDIVYAHYQEEVNAMRRLDAKALCGMMAKDYRHVEIERTAKGEERIELGRDDTCTAIQVSMRALYKVAKPMKIAPDVKYTIESVTLSPDHRQATVKLRSSLKIGRRVSIESTGTETLVRTLGEVRSVSAESRTTMKLR